MKANVDRFFILLLYTVSMLPFVAKGAISALETNANSPVDWVSADFPAKEVYERFRLRFGAGDVVVMSWDGCTIDNAQLDELTTCLRRSKAFHTAEQQPYFERVISGREEYLKLMAAPLSLSAAEAQRRLHGALIGPDQLTTCLVVTFNDRGLAERSRLVPLLHSAAKKFCDVDESDIHVAGPVIDGLTVDTASQRAMDSCSPLSSVIVLVLCWICLRSIPAALLVFAVSLLCQGVTLALIHYCGDTMSALLIVLPPLVQVLAVAGGIHLVNYYFDSAQSDGTGNASERAFRVGWLPCVLSAATTAIGLGSLMVSRLLPVREFGMYAAAGVMITVATLLSFIPGYLLIRPPHIPLSRSTHRGWLTWEPLVNVLAKHHAILTVATAVGMAVMAYGATQLRTSVRIETLFDSESKMIRDYEWLEQQIGPLVPIEVVVDCDPSCRLRLTDRLRLLAAIEQALQQMPDVEGSMSPLTFLPEDVLQKQDSRVKQAVVNRRLHELRPALAEANALCVDGETEHWRVTGFVSALQDIDYGLFLHDVQDQINPLIQNEDRRIRGVSFEVTGIMPLVHEIQRQLLHDLFASFLTAFGVIAIVMTLVQAGFRAGLVVMIPNVFPTLMMFGALGWQQFPMDIGSVMTASVALGIAVDDTLHFLTFYRRMLAEGNSRRDAVLQACRHCGRAMIHTTVICGIGLLAFALADFVPTARFAWMMLALLVVALFGDLVVLPALLLGPAGKLFTTVTVERQSVDHLPAEDSQPPPPSQMETGRTFSPEEDPVNVTRAPCISSN